MGLLQKAYETYENHRSYVGKYLNNEESREPLAPVAHIITSAQITITIDCNGQFLGAELVGKGEPKIIIPVTEESAGRTSGVCPHPLCDNLGYLAPENETKYSAYIEQLTDWTESEYTHPMLRPILTYVKNQTILADLGRAGIEKYSEKDTVRWIVLGLESGAGNCWTDPTLFDAFGKVKTTEEYAAKACAEWLDVRSFGQLFAFKADNVSVGVRGPVSLHQAISVSPVEVQSIQITKSVNGEPAEKRASDTMGMKHFVRFGLYQIKGSINVQLAEKTGFSWEDAQVVKEALRTLFINDASSARPDGSMEVVKLYWWEHNCKDGQYSSAKVHKLLRVALNDSVIMPNSVEDYTITVDSLPDLAMEEIDGI